MSIEHLTLGQIKEIQDASKNAKTFPEWKQTLKGYRDQFGLTDRETIRIATQFPRGPFEAEVQQPVQMDDNFCPECGTEFLSCCKQLLAQKRVVTREWVFKWAVDLADTNKKDGYKTLIKEMLNELGIEVTE